MSLENQYNGKIRPQSGSNKELNPIDYKDAKSPTLYLYFCHLCSYKHCIMTKSIQSFFLIVVALSLFSCTQEPKKITSYVNPFIGTGGHGHTYPGATLPFGMVQLSPDTRINDWDGCSGYHYSDSTILGFSHTHLSGTGVGDYGDIRLMPTVGK